METLKRQAENLPEGWIWINYDDGSGYLQSPDGKEYFEYDWTTGEYKVTPDKSYDFFMVENYQSGGYSIGGFDKFKEYAEDYINKNILNEIEKKGLENNNENEINNNEEIEEIDEPDICDDD